MSLNSLQELQQEAQDLWISMCERIPAVIARLQLHPEDLEAVDEGWDTRGIVFAWVQHEMELRAQLISSSLAQAYDHVRQFHRRRAYALRLLDRLSHLLIGAA